MKRQGARSSATPAPGVRLWRVKFHREVAKLIAKHGNDNDVRPALGELWRALESDPKQFAKKRGALRGARAADITYADGVAWRAVFTLDEAERVVKVLALDPHDVAHEAAARRT